jgi:hypothetical protein
MAPAEVAGQDFHLRVRNTTLPDRLRKIVLIRESSDVFQEQLQEQRPHKSPCLSSLEPHSDPENQGQVCAKQ